MTAVPKRGVPLASVEPFFQVVIFTDVAGKVDVKEELRKAIGAKVRKDAEFRIVHGEHRAGLDYVYVVHKARPRWIRGTTTLRNVEHDEAMFYRAAGFVFVHSNCSALLDVLTAWCATKFSKVRATDIEKLVELRNVEMRCLGMQNLFTPGGTAPEAKTLFARDAASALSPAVDSSFGLKYCFAAEPASAGTTHPQPFGCSPGKRKVWRTWVKDAAAFRRECDQLAVDLRAPRVRRGGRILAERVDILPSNLEPIAFYADFTIERRGVLWLEVAAGAWSHDWNAYLLNHHAVRFEVRDTSGSSQSFDLEIAHSQDGVTLAYPAGTAAQKVTVCDDGESPERRKKRDLLEFLTSEQAFTVVFTNGLAFREGDFLRDTSLDQVFVTARTDMHFTSIDLTKETRIAGRTDTIGDAILHFLHAQPWVEMVICDDGANEVADYLALGDAHLAFIHAKYSSDRAPGLRVGDIQEVFAQAIKNRHYFTWRALERQSTRLAAGVLPGFRATSNPIDRLRAIYDNQRSIRECWIVQPGLSTAQLAADPANKIHSLLNYADSAFRGGNIAFHFFGSP